LGAHPVLHSFPTRRSSDLGPVELFAHHRLNFGIGFHRLLLRFSLHFPQISDPFLQLDLFRFEVFECHDIDLLKFISKMALTHCGCSGSSVSSSDPSPSSRITSGAFYCASASLDVAAPLAPVSPALFQAHAGV